MFAKEDLLLPCTFVLALLVIPAAFAWIELFKFWRRQIRGTSFSSIFSTAQMLFWLLQVAVLSFCSIVILWLFSLYIWFFILTN